MRPQIARLVTRTKVAIVNLVGTKHFDHYKTKLKSSFPEIKLLRFSKCYANTKKYINKYVHT